MGAARPGGPFAQAATSMVMSMAPGGCCSARGPGQAGQSHGGGWAGWLAGCAPPGGGWPGPRGAAPGWTDINGRSASAAWGGSRLLAGAPVGAASSFLLAVPRAAAARRSPGPRGGRRGWRSRRRPPSPSPGERAHARRPGPGPFDSVRVTRSRWPAPARLVVGRRRRRCPAGCARLAPRRRPGASTSRRGSVAEGRRAERAGYGAMCSAG